MSYNFRNAIKTLCECGYRIPEGAPRIAVRNAKDMLVEACNSICEQKGQTFIWNDAYAPIAEWLADSKGKSLLIMGNTGSGKTLMMDAIALIIFITSHIVFKKSHARDITTATALREFVSAGSYMALDDLGAEATVREYGNVIGIADELSEAVDRDCKLAIVTTNLDSKALQERYGSRVYDRLRGNFKVVALSLDSHR